MYELMMIHALVKALMNVHYCTFIVKCSQRWKIANHEGQFLSSTILSWYCVACSVCRQPSTLSSPLGLVRPSTVPVGLVRPSTVPVGLVRPSTVPVGFDGYWDQPRYKMLSRDAVSSIILSLNSRPCLLGPSKSLWHSTWIIHDHPTPTPTILSLLLSPTSTLCMSSLTISYSCSSSHPSASPPPLSLSGWLIFLELVKAISCKAILWFDLTFPALAERDGGYASLGCPW